MAEFAPSSSSSSSPPAAAAAAAAADSSSTPSLPAASAPPDLTLSELSARLVNSLDFSQLPAEGPSLLTPLELRTLMPERQAVVAARLRHINGAGSVHQPELAEQFWALRREFWAHAKTAWDKGAKYNIQSDVRNFAVWFCRSVKNPEVQEIVLRAAFLGAEAAMQRRGGPHRAAFLSTSRATGLKSHYYMYLFFGEAVCNTTRSMQYIGQLLRARGKTPKVPFAELVEVLWRLVLGTRGFADEVATPTTKDVLTLRAFYVEEMEKSRSLVVAQSTIGEEEGEKRGRGAADNASQVFVDEEDFGGWTGAFAEQEGEDEGEGEREGKGKGKEEGEEEEEEEVEKARKGDAESVRELSVMEHQPPVENDARRERLTSLLRELAAAELPEDMSKHITEGLQGLKMVCSSYVGLLENDRDQEHAQ